MTIMKCILGSGWPPLLECRVCGAQVHAETGTRGGSERLSWGAMTSCPRGCTLQALDGLRIAQRQAREDALQAKKQRFKSSRQLYTQRENEHLIF